MRERKRVEHGGRGVQRSCIPSCAPHSNQRVGTSVMAPHVTIYLVLLSDAGSKGDHGAWVTWLQYLIVLQPEHWSREVSEL